MFNKIQFTIADRINQANNPNLDAVNQLPKSTTTLNKPNLALNTTDLNQADNQVNTQQDRAINQTNPEQVNTIYNKQLSPTTYNKQLSPEYPSNPDPTVITPTPKNKTFTETLLDKKNSQYLNNKQPNPDNRQSTYPDQSDNVYTQYPESNVPIRPDIIQNNPRADLPTLTSPDYKKGPQYGNGPQYKPKTFNIQKLPKPKFG